MTIVDLPFVRRVHGIPHRASNSRTCTVVESVPCSIPEASSSELDVVLEVEHADKLNAYHSYGDALVSPSRLHSSELEQELRAFASFMRAAQEGRFGHATPLMQHLGARSGETEVLIGERMHERLRELVRDDHDRDRTAFDRAAGQLLILDGRLTRLLPDPVWVVSKLHSGISVDLLFDRPPVNATAFRFDRLQQAEEYAEHLARRTIGGTSHLVREHGSRRWQFDEENHSLKELQSRLLSYWSQEGVQSHLHRQPVEFFVDYCGLRDASTVEEALKHADRLTAFIEGLGPKTPLRPFVEPVELWSWKQRALADRRDIEDPEELDGLRI